MKRIAGIFLLTIYLFSFAEVHNLVKIPVLFQHFKEHKQQDPSISFWDFIKIHYMDPIVVDDDYHRDQQLPFRDAGCCQLVNISVFEMTPMTVEIGSLPEPPREFHHTDEQDNAQFTPFGIFQPPRCA